MTGNSPASIVAVAFDDVKFTVVDLGPSESPHDSAWIVGDDAKTVFLGDQIYDHRHCYLADGFYTAWLANIEKLRARFPEDAVFYIGHGGPVGPEMWDWQRGYIELFVEAVSNADWSDPGRAKAAIIGRMKAYEPFRRAAVPDGAEHRAGRGRARAADDDCLRPGRSARAYTPDSLRQVNRRIGVSGGTDGSVRDHR